MRTDDLGRVSVLAYAVRVSEATGAAMKAARDRAKLTQQDVAKALGVKQAAVSKWENGRSLPELGTLVRLAALLACRVDDLVVGINADYDRLRRDLSGQGNGALSAHAAATPDPAPERESRVRFVAALEEVTAELFKLVSDEQRQLGAKARKTSGGASGRRRRA